MRDTGNDDVIETRRLLCGILSTVSVNANEFGSHNVSFGYLSLCFVPSNTMSLEVRQ